MKCWCDDVYEYICVDCLSKQKASNLTSLETVKLKRYCKLILCEKHNIEEMRPLVKFVFDNELD